MGSLASAGRCAGTRGCFARSTRARARERYGHVVAAQVLACQEWTPEQAKDAVSKHPRAQPVREPPARSAERQEYWLSEDRGFGIVVAQDRWSLHSRGKCLSSWRARGNGTGGDHLELSKGSDRLCEWVAKQWVVVAYGGDYRPQALLAIIRSQQVVVQRKRETGPRN